MAESFDIKKLVVSPFTGLFWVKTIMFMFGMAFLAFVVWGVYGFYFKPKPPTTTQNNQAENIAYHYPTPKATFGCASVRVQEYYGKKTDNLNAVR